ncbi:potassium channel family protein [Tundrisphaera lichenicola]|uniref:potassium channel family protein n=1 Tax=Tundrisphaera lichenicola TaxID=2029860 RepID=UPI003EB9F772
MSTLIVLSALILIVAILHDGFEVILLPRRVSRGLRLAGLFYMTSWPFWRTATRLVRKPKSREVLLSWFGPASVLGLFLLWAVGLIFGFAAIHTALKTPMNTPAAQVPEHGDYLYFSGVTFFTLGFGDISPTRPLGRMLAVGEAGLGFAFLAVIISYVPVFYQAFSAREITISLLDARAGSPPRASSLLTRIGSSRNFETLDRYLQEWERWSAQVLEGHLSFPLLSYYRSQHDNQSWLSAITMILDASTLVIAGVKDVDLHQAQLTFAMSRHAVVDIAQVFRVRPTNPASDRLPPEALTRLLGELRKAGFEVSDPGSVEANLAELRQLYEPFVAGLSDYLLLPLPPIWAEAASVDNWQTSAWMKRASGIGRLAQAVPDDHDD